MKIEADPVVTKAAIDTTTSSRSESADRLSCAKSCPVLFCWPFLLVRCRLDKLRVIDWNVLFHFADLNGESSTGPRQGPAIRNLHAIGVAIIRVIDLGWQPSQRGLSVAVPTALAVQIAGQNTTQSAASLRAGPLPRRPRDRRLSPYRAAVSALNIAFKCVARCRSASIAAPSRSLPCISRKGWPGIPSQPSCPLNAVTLSPSGIWVNEIALLRILRINIDGQRFAAKIDRPFHHAAA